MEMDNAMVIENLSKAYPGFALSEVSMTLPRGSIMGFIGENGAGKTTTIKLILNMLHRDSGSVRILGKDNIKEEKAVKERLGVVLGDLNLPETMNGLKINSMMSGIYPGWEEDVFFFFQPGTVRPSEKQENQGLFPRYENEAVHSNCSVAWG